MKLWQGAADEELLAGNWQQCAVGDPFGTIPQSASDWVFGEILRNAGDREFGAILQSEGDREFGLIRQLPDNGTLGAIRKRVIFRAFGERRRGAGRSAIRLA